VFFDELIKSFLLPPMLFLILALIGLGISMMWKKLGVAVAAGSLVLMLLFSMPVVTGMLMSGLQTYPAITEQNLKKALNDADALVVLGGGQRRMTPEFEQDTVSEYTLERVRYAAWLAKRTGLPLIISGGKRSKDSLPVSELMQEVLQKEFVAIVDDIETTSRNTFENARYTAEVLNKHKMKKIALVTHAWHMPRAKKAFEHFDIQVIPAPTAFYGQSKTLSVSDFIPSTNALNYSNIAFREIVGQFWYDLVYY